MICWESQLPCNFFSQLAVLGAMQQIDVNLQPDLPQPKVSGDICPFLLCILVTHSMALKVHAMMMSLTWLEIIQVAELSWCINMCSESATIVKTTQQNLFGLFYFILDIPPLVLINATQWTLKNQKDCRTVIAGLWGESWKPINDLPHLGQMSTFLPQREHLLCKIVMLSVWQTPQWQVSCVITLTC